MKKMIFTWKLKVKIIDTLKIFKRNYQMYNWAVLSFHFSVLFSTIVYLLFRCCHVLTRLLKAGLFDGER